jgi:precorrin-3B methylase
MKRAKPGWEETARREVGVVTGDGDKGHYLAILYMVTECRKVGRQAVEWRERLVPGTTLCQATTGQIGASALLDVVDKGVRALSHLARKRTRPQLPGVRGDNHLNAALRRRRR